MRSTSLRPRAFWLYRNTRISHDFGLYGQQLARATSPQSTRHDHAAEIETIWRSLSEDQRATYFITGPAGEEVPKQPLDASLGIVYNIVPELSLQDVSTQAICSTYMGALPCLALASLLTWLLDASYRSLVKMIEVQAVEPAKALKNVINELDKQVEKGRLQVLWKLRKYGAYSVFLPGCRIEQVLCQAFQQDRIRVTEWLQAAFLYWIH